MDKCHKEAASGVPLADAEGNADFNNSRSPAYIVAFV
jgi:hypothetical protein